MEFLAKRELRMRALLTSRASARALASHLLFVFANEIVYVWCFLNESILK